MNLTEARALAHEASSHLREEADFNRSWTDGRRGADLPKSQEYIARRLEVAEQRERWADAITALSNELTPRQDLNRDCRSYSGKRGTSSLTGGQGETAA